MSSPIIFSRGAGRLRRHAGARIALTAMTGLLALSAVPAGAVATATVHLTDSSKGRTVVVTPGTKVVVVLHSTYWSLQRVVATNVIRQVGGTSTIGVAPGSHSCVPGQGCGTVSALFVANHAGTYRLHASRVSCGEALRCSTAQSSWTVTIRVR